MQTNCLTTCRSSKSSSQAERQPLSKGYSFPVGAPLIVEMSCLSSILLLVVLVADVSAHHCMFHCDPVTGLRNEELFAITYGYEGLSQCNDPTHCDDSTLGTGHKLFSILSEDLIAVERCFSFCYTNVSLVGHACVCGV